MRHEAQRTIHLQNMLPAGDCAGHPFDIGGQAAINRAYAAWLKRRGIGEPVWKMRYGKKAETAAPPPPKPPGRRKPTPEEVEASRLRKKETDKAWRERNKAAIQNKRKRQWAKLTPEEKAARAAYWRQWKAEKKKIQP